MTIKKKGLYWGAGIIGFMLAIAVSVMQFAPVYLNTPAVSHRIQTALSQKMGGRVAFERLDVSFFPRLRMTVKRLSLSFPKTFRGTLESVSVYPQLLPSSKEKCSFLRSR